SALRVVRRDENEKHVRPTGARHRALHLPDRYRRHAAARVARREGARPRRRGARASSRELSLPCHCPSLPPALPPCSTSTRRPSREPLAPEPASRHPKQRQRPTRLLLLPRHQPPALAPQALAREHPP